MNRKEAVTMAEEMIGSELENQIPPYARGALASLMTDVFLLKETIGLRKTSQILLCMTKAVVEEFSQQKTHEPGH